MTDRGSALLETLVFGFLAVLLAAQVVVAVGRVAVAGEHAAGAARTAAVIAAREGKPDRAAELAAQLAPDGEVRVWTSDGAVTVEVTLDVAILGPEGSAIRVPVRGAATAPIGPYQSVPEANEP